MSERPFALVFAKYASVLKPFHYFRIRAHIPCSAPADNATLTVRFLEPWRDCLPLRASRENVARLLVSRKIGRPVNVLRNR